MSSFTELEPFYSILARKWHSVLHQAIRVCFRHRTPTQYLSLYATLHKHSSEDVNFVIFVDGDSYEKALVYLQIARLSINEPPLCYNTSLIMETGHISMLVNTSTTDPDYKYLKKEHLNLQTILIYRLLFECERPVLTGSRDSS